MLRNVRQKLDIAWNTPTTAPDGREPNPSLSRDRGGGLAKPRAMPSGQNLIPHPANARVPRAPTSLAAPGYARLRSAGVSLFNYHLSLGNGLEFSARV
jgi:hypothetical protein